jgi:hypothetical protein
MRPAGRSAEHLTVFAHWPVQTAGTRGSSPTLEVPVSVRSVLITAVVALAVVVGYDQYKQRKGA